MVTQTKKVVIDEIPHTILEDEDSTDADKFAASIVPQTDDPTAPAFTYLLPFIC